MRLSAGREAMSDELQALCFLAGANSIFYGEKLLTTGNPDVAHDRRCSPARHRADGRRPVSPRSDTRPRAGAAVHVHGPDCSHAPARPGAACNATRQR